MMASERLRELLPSVDGVTGLYPNGPWFDLDGEKLVNLETALVLADALPLIADVVEALESVVPHLPYVKKIKRDPSEPYPPKVIAKAALSALDEALS